ncbi:hypothetical protein BDZ94DRAFT_1227017 [Collybia nuda]|uniref:Uncharacterized protein n=1 Tax=Collybia nuda TaxID=64659 RepID=A0A9P6CA34_9AGAR|nr:hypothetical protein BDZ94DRAFT_1227017 [Collybia nuda]
MNLLIGVAFLAAFISVGVTRARPSDQGFGLVGDLQAEDRAFRFSRRQTPNGPPPAPSLPPECQTICDPVNSAIETCTPTSCCTSTFETAFFGCFICIGGTTTTSNYTMIQGILDDLVRTCANNGIQIPTLTFPGQDPNRPLSGAGNSSTATGPTTPNTRSPSAGVGSTTTSASLIITTDLGPPQQTTITSLPTTTGPNAPTDTAFTPPNNSGWRMMTGQRWAGMTILTVGSLLGGFLIF